MAARARLLSIWERGYFEMYVTLCDIRRSYPHAFKISNPGQMSYPSPSSIAHGWRQTAMAVGKTSAEDDTREGSG